MAYFRIAALVLSGFVLASLTGCGGSDNQPKPKDDLKIDFKPRDPPTLGPGGGGGKPAPGAAPNKGGGAAV